MAGWDLSNPKTLLANRYTQVFNSALFSALFLSLPFVFMIANGFASNVKRKKIGFFESAGQSGAKR